MSEWIIDRKPTVDDAQNMAGYVWLASPDPYGYGEYTTLPTHWTNVKDSDVWCVIEVPHYTKEQP